MKISKLAAALFAAILLPAATAGGLQDKMDAQFNAMQAGGDQIPGYEQLSGRFSGGNGFSVEAGIVPEAVQQVQPSELGGCGLINPYDDAFEYINHDNFTDFQKRIASEAKGYAFNIALDVACSQCMSWINALQAKVQNMNQTNMTNCRIQQGVVTDSPSAYNAARANDFTLAGASSGLYGTYFEAQSQLDGRNLRSEVETNATGKASEIIGNIVWQELKRHAVKDWVVDPATDEGTEYGILMAFTGSVIIPASVVGSELDADGNAKNTTNPIYLPATISFKDLIEGGTLTTYACGDADTLCLTPSTTSTSVTGIADRIHDSLVSLINRFRTEGAATFTDQELNLLSNMPQPVGAMIRNLAVSSQRTAMQMSRDTAYAVAMSMAYETLNDNLNAIETAVRSSIKPEAKLVVDMIRERRRVLANDYAAYARTHKTVSEILEQYNDIMKNTQLLSVEIARLGAAGNR